MILAAELLNNREIAVLVWLGVFVGFALCVKATRELMPDLLRQIFASRLTFIFVAILTYVGLVVCGLRSVHAWGPDQLFETVFWLFGPGIVLVGRLTEARKHPHPLRRYLREAVALSVLIEFIDGVHTFVLRVELVFVPTVALLAMLLVVASSNPEYKQVEKLVNVVLGLVGLWLLSRAVIYVVRHSTEVFTPDTARDFSVPLMLTIAFLPFAYLLAVLMAYQTMLALVSLKVPKGSELYRYARGQAFHAAGLRLSSVRRLDPLISRYTYIDCTGADVDRAIGEFHFRGVDSTSEVCS